jgi:NAD(P)H:quinone oxidoreductase type IV
LPSFIYYGATGTTYHLARAVEQGASETGAEVRLRKVLELAPDEAIASNQGWAAHRLESQHVKEATNDDLLWADAIIFGTPTRYGLPTAQLKQFLDTTGPLWAKGALVNKVCSSFSSSATARGGQETTIVNLNTTFYHWGRDHCRARVRRPDSVQSWESLRRVIHEQQRRPQTGRDGTGGSALPRQACSRIGCAVCRWTQRLASVKSGVAMESIKKRAH